MDNQTLPSAQNDPAVVKYRRPLSDVEKIVLSVLHEIEEYLDGKSDVIDGDYGQPRPNREMTLLGEVQLAIAAVWRDK